MKNEKRIVFTWLIAIGAVITGAIAVSCSSLDLDSGNGGYSSPGSKPAPAAPC